MGGCLLRPRCHGYKDLRRAWGRGGGSHACVLCMLAGSRGSPLFREDHQQGRSSVPNEGHLDVAQLPVLPKNLAKNFMNTFFAQREYCLTLDESARLSAQVCRSHSYSRFETLLVMPLRTRVDILPPMYRRLGLGCRIAFTIASGFDLVALLPCPGS
jgi:hypothetical protein